MNLIFLLQVSNQPNSTVKKVPLWDIIDASNAGIGWVINLILLIMLGYTIFVFVEIAEIDNGFPRGFSNSGGYSLHPLIRKKITTQANN